MRSVPVVALALAVSTASVPSSAKVDHPVYASTVTTSGLVADCEKYERTPMGQTFCLGYAMGVLDSLLLEGLVCTDAGFTTSQGIAVARKWLRDHPERWNEHPAILLRDGFEAAFPCAGKKGL